MSTWLHLATRNEDYDAQEDHTHEMYDAGPCLCYNGSTELCKVMVRYEHQEITPELSQRVQKLTRFLEREAAEHKPDDTLISEIEAWMNDNMGKTLHLQHH